jgi:membrane associated rhomboid family serine protease
MAAAARSSLLGLTLRWVALLWLLFAIDLVVYALTGISLSALLAVRPRDSWGLVGIAGAHFFHASSGPYPPHLFGISLGHILSNTIALVPLLLLALGQSRTLTAFAILYSMLLAGAVTWTFGARDSLHIGFSGVIFGLVGFLIANGLLRRSLGALLIAVLVALLYGASLWLVLPDRQHPTMSWQMHLGGLIGGLLASWHLRHDKPRD